MKLRNQQQGIVSIFTATLLIIVISLVVLGLAQIARREQRISLDTQLSAQAFYAAESGVNDAITAIQSRLDSGASVSSKTVCGVDTTNYPTLNTPTLSSGVGYTCLLINAKPEELTTNLTSNSSVLALTPETPANLNQIILEWDPDPSAGSFANCEPNLFPNTTNYFSANDNWGCNFGMVRVDLVKTTSLTRSALQSSTATFFLVPTRNGGTSPDYTTLLAASRNGSVMAADCHTVAGVCRSTVNVTPGNYYMRATATYRSGFDLRVSTNASAGNFVGSQAVIDVTGQAQDVLRRLLVNVNLNSDLAGVASYALMSGDSICKRFSVSPGQPLENGSSIIGGDDNPLCGVVAASAAAVGDSRFDTGVPGGGSSGSGGSSPGPFWTRNFTNTSANAPSTVTGCDWDWGDGTHSYTSCYSGDTISHLFPMIATCTPYTVRLTVNTTTGPYYFVRTIREPHGSASPC